MRTIQEDLLIEELQSLLEGKTIDFLELEDEQVSIKISGKNFYGSVFELMQSVLKMNHKRFALMKDILERYDNEEYWNNDILDNPDYDIEFFEGDTCPKCHKGKLITYNNDKSNEVILCCEECEEIIDTASQTGDDEN